jgi:hypothetical protein
VQKLLGSEAAVSSVVYRGAPIAAGIFTGGTGIIGFEEGVLLSSGNIASVVGPTNDSPQTSTDSQMPGDPDLSALLGGVTQDASVLEFDVESQTGGMLSFDYVFASEEYDCGAEDGFACILNGHNIALVPGTNLPVMVGTVNCGLCYYPPTSCNLFRVNDCDSLGPGFPCTNIPRKWTASRWSSPRQARCTLD